MRIAPFVAAVAALGVLGCSKPDAGKEVVATANGDVIMVADVREALTGGAGAVALPDIPVAKKREALDQAIAICLLGQAARAKGFDNTDEFKSVVAQNARGIVINALFRRDIATGLKISADDVKARATKLRESDKSLTEENASLQARRMILEEKVRKLEEDLVAAARKDFPVAPNQDVLGRIGKGEKVPDNAVVGTAGSERFTAGQMRKLMAAMTGGPHGSDELSRDPGAVARLLERELTGMALASYARKQGIEGSEWAKAAQKDLERKVLYNLLASREVFKGISVSDKEIAAAYAEHAQSLVRNGRKVPLAEVKPQISEFLLNEKRRKAIDAYIAELKKKSTITVKEDVLAKV